MKTKLSGLAAALAISLFAMTASAHAEITYLRDFPGWEAAVQPNGAIRITRTDRSILAAYIYLFPTDKTPVTTKEEAFSRIDAIKNTVAGDFKNCAPIKDREAKPNGMGMEVMDRDENPKCHLFIGATKQGHLFANVRLEDGALGRKSLPSQRSAGIFLSLAVARLKGDEFLKSKDEIVDLSQFKMLVHEDNMPVHAIIAHKPLVGLYGDWYDAVYLLKNHTATNCADWDPSFYTPSTLAKVKAKPSAIFNLGPCKIFAWKKDPESGLSLHAAGEWNSPAEVLDRNILETRISPFTENEKLMFLSGSKARLYPVVQEKADIRTLSDEDAFFTPDGRFLIGDIGLTNRPLHLPKQQSGRYYIDGNFVIMELDAGPTLVGLGGKIEVDGKVTGLFIGSAAFGDIQ